MTTVRRVKKLAVRVVCIEKNRTVSSTDVEQLIPDATEQPVQRPKKGQCEYHSG
ncbi:hypothetical protein QUF90_01230 [Desulfococcaceae bacterium HSG9]|nr:hypothetical protein [Desulfococcaceae bacterium HSG9]